MRLSYVSHPISSDNDLMPEKLLFESGLFCILNVVMSVAYV